MADIPAHVLNAPWLAERFPEIKVENQKAVQDMFIAGYERSSRTPERAAFLIDRYKRQIAEGHHVYVDRTKADNVYIASDEPVLDVKDLQDFDLSEDFTDLDWGENRDQAIARVHGVMSRWYVLTIRAAEIVEHAMRSRRDDG